jgi:hypothetical protein
MSNAFAKKVTVLVLSDIHFAGPGERARGSDYELAPIKKPLLRFFAGALRHVIWMRDPLARSPQLQVFLNKARAADLVVVNGDYTLDSGFIGLADEACLESARECLGRLRAQFGDRLHLVIGDHDLGKKAMFSDLGSMRLASWQVTTETLGIKPFWQLSVGNYLLLAVTSSLIALPAHQVDALPEEWAEWQRLREEHMAAISAVFDSLLPGQRVILFCHDPTALPFLALEESVQRRMPQIEHTIIGHLHTDMILWKSRLLAGMPVVRAFGPAVYKMSAALHKAQAWRPFKVCLCPALAGIELFNDGGYLSLTLDPAARQPGEITFHPLPR